MGIDVKDMSLMADIDTEGVKPYTIGCADGKNGTLNKLYTMTRKSPWIEKVDLTTHELLGKIDLAHTPRSCAYNEVMGAEEREAFIVQRQASGQGMGGKNR